MKEVTAHLSERIALRRVETNEILARMPLMNSCLYSDCWTSKGDHRGFIEVTQSFVIHGKRGRHTLGLHEFQLISKKMLEELQTDEYKLQTQNSGILESELNSMETDAFSMDDTQNEQDLSQQSSEYNDIVQELLDEGASILPSENIEENDFLDTEEKMDAAAYRKARIAATKEHLIEQAWINDLDEQELKDKHLLIFEFTDKLGFHQKCVVSKQTGMQIGLVLKKIIAKAKHHNIAGELDATFRTPLITDSGIFYIYFCMPLFLMILFPNM